MSRTLRPLYWLYESRLRRQIGSHPVPRHVGIILDGNRRYARKYGLADPRAAYDLGADKLDDVLAWCSDLAILAVTLWVCSIDNLKRPQTEVAGILAAVEMKISALTNDSDQRPCDSSSPRSRQGGGSPRPPAAIDCDGASGG
jgi:short-chain Z-isoprenyl diphosphate synthase